MKKVIYVIWRFDDLSVEKWNMFENGFKYMSYNLSNNESNKLIAIKLIEEDTVDIQLIKNMIIENNKEFNLCLVLCHNKPPITDTFLSENNYRGFGGGILGDHKIIYDKLLNGNYFKDDVISDGKIKDEIFNDLWKEYYIRLPLKDLKNEIINLLLPLAIDIQGLKDNKQKNLTDYYHEIKKDVDSNKYILLEKWDKLNQINYRIKDKELPVKIINFISDNSKADDFYNEYVSKREKYLPDWFQMVVGKIEVEINNENE